MTPLKSQKTVAIILPTDGTDILFNCWRHRMLPLHRLLFCLRFIVMDPSFIARDQPVLKVLWVRVIKSQKFFRDSYSFIHFMFSEHFSDPTSKNLFIPSSSWMMVNAEPILISRTLAIFSMVTLLSAIIS